MSTTSKNNLQFYMCMCMHACLCVCVCACMRVYMCVSVSVSVWERDTSKPTYTVMHIIQQDHPYSNKAIPPNIAIPYGPSIQTQSLWEPNYSNHQCPIAREIIENLGWLPTLKSPGMRTAANASLVPVNIVTIHTARVEWTMWDRRLRLQEEKEGNCLLFNTCLCHAPKPRACASFSIWASLIWPPLLLFFHFERDDFWTQLFRVKMTNLAFPHFLDKYITTIPTTLLLFGCK